MANADTSPPVLTGLTLPASIDVTSGGYNASFSAQGTDVGSGIQHIDVKLDRNFQSAYAATPWLSFYDSSDSFSDGSSTLFQYFSDLTPPGTYTVTAAYVYDKAGNTTIYSADQLASLGIATSFEVVSNATADNTPPTLTGLTLPATIDVRNGGQNASFAVQASDIGQGIKSIDLQLDHSYQSANGNASWLSFYDSSDSFADGSSTTFQFFSDLTDAGTYNVISAYVYDKAGNYTIYNAADLASLGIDTSFEVLSNAVADTTPPSLTGLTLPASIDITNGGQNVSFAAQASDVGLGVKYIEVKLDRYYQSAYGATPWLSFYDSSDSFSDGSSALSQYFSDQTVPGTYNVTAAYVYDKAGNATIYYADQLAALGIGTSFKVFDHDATVTASALAPVKVVEGQDAGFSISVTLKDVTTTSGTFKLSLLPSGTADASDVSVPAFMQYFSVTQSPAGDYVLTTPEITILDDLIAEGVKTIDIEVQVTGQIFASGTDSTVVHVSLVDGDQVGTSGNDVLRGTRGMDLLKGGAGDDTYYVNNPADNVVEYANQGIDTIYSTVSYSLAGRQVEVLTLTGGGALNATGNAFDNTLTGNAGANVLDGKAGADTMKGGGGNDTYYVDNAGDVVIELANGGTDTVYSSVSYSIAATQVEKLILQGGAAINATGNALDNVLTGSSGANILDGGTGADTMSGGAGADTYYVDNALDRVIEFANAGIDTVYASVSYSLTGTQAENLFLTGSSAINATGNALANSLTGNSGANILDGKAGADTMKGGAGDDTYYVDNIGDVVIEQAGSGTDTVLSSISYTIAGKQVENLTLTGSGAIDATGSSLANLLHGNSGANTISGGAGDDGIWGGLGNDILIGGAGRDTFHFDTLPGAKNVDVIQDFSVVDDQIFLDHAIFTALAPGDLAASAFEIGTAATSADTRILYNSATGALSYDADGNGSGAAIKFASLAAGLALTHADFG